MLRVQGPVTENGRRSPRLRKSEESKARKNLIPVEIISYCVR